MNSEYEDADKLRDIVKARTANISRNQFSKLLGLDRSHLSRFMMGRTGPPPAILAELGYERVVVYRRKK